MSLGPETSLRVDQTSPWEIYTACDVELGPMLNQQNQTININTKAIETCLLDIDPAAKGQVLFIASTQQTAGREAQKGVPYGDAATIGCCILEENTDGARAARVYSGMTRAENFWGAHKRQEVAVHELSHAADIGNFERLQDELDAYYTDHFIKLCKVIAGTFARTLVGPNHSSRQRSKYTGLARLVRALVTSSVRYENYVEEMNEEASYYSPNEARAYRIEKKCMSYPTIITME